MPKTGDRVVGRGINQTRAASLSRKRRRAARPLEERSLDAHATVIPAGGLHRPRRRLGGGVDDVGARVRTRVERGRCVRGGRGRRRVRRRRRAVSHRAHGGGRRTRCANRAVRRRRAGALARAVDAFVPWDIMASGVQRAADAKSLGGSLYITTSLLWDESAVKRVRNVHWELDDDDRIVSKSLGVDDDEIGGKRRRRQA